MGPEPVERLHVSLINTGTALHTAPLVNTLTSERDGQERKRKPAQQSQRERGKFRRNKTGKSESQRNR